MAELKFIYKDLKEFDHKKSKTAVFKVRLEQFFLVNEMKKDGKYKNAVLLSSCLEKTFIYGAIYVHQVYQKGTRILS